jgi:hypothetical protein
MTVTTIGGLAADTARTARIIARHLEAMAGELDSQPPAPPPAPPPPARADGRTVPVIRSS